MNGCICIAFLYSLVRIVHSNCPAAAPGDCTCQTFSTGPNVKCKGSSSINDIPSWIPNNTVYLELDDCNIQTLTNQSFKNLLSLKRIRITNQKRPLTIADGLVFQGLEDLDHVDLGGNTIPSLPEKLFANLSRLNTVGLDNNPLETLPDNLFEMSPNVATLRLGYTQLSRDVLSKIGEGKFGTNIEALLISGTLIENFFDNFFTGLPKLSRVAAVNCGLKYIGADILKQTEATIFIINDNPITDIKENAFRGSVLREFGCSNCNLTTNVTFNGFLKITSVTKIQLENNKITGVPKNAFMNLNNLHLIDLSNNKIATVEENAFVNLPKCRDTTCIQLDGNPLNCDCNMAWLRSYAEGKGSIDSWKCHQPPSLSGKTFESVKVDDFCCENVITGKKCGMSNPNSAWVVSGHLVSILSQVVVLFGIPLLLF